MSLETVQLRVRPITEEELHSVEHSQHMLAEPESWPRNPWSVMIDGDLWAVFHNLVMRKGAEAIKITLTKGHIKQEQVDSGTQTQRAKDGNDTADRLADKGVQHHPGRLRIIASVWAERQAAYYQLVRDIHTFIAFILSVDATRREAQKKHQALFLAPASHQRSMVATMLRYDADGRFLTLLLLSSNW